MAVLTAALLVGCAHVDDAPPRLPLPQAAAFRGAQPAKPAAPLAVDGWWRLYGDPELDRLQERLLVDSPDLAAALARYEQARAATEAVRATRAPTVDVVADVSRNRQSDRRPLRGASSPDDYNSGTVGIDAGYELDLWGRIRRQVTAGLAEEQAAKADLDGARLALQATLADTVISLRGLDHELALLRDTEAAFGRALDMVQERHAAGLASGLDLAQAQTQLDTTKSQHQQARAQRELLEHAAAALVGAHASDFAIQPADGPTDVARIVPAVPLGLPSELLQRRPDIVAARERVTAANASVGLARTAHFPSVRLGATAGLQSADLRNVIAAPNLFWALGPGLLMNVFDGGRRQAEVARAEAVLDETGARYRAVVIGAFEQVENQLALLHSYEQAAASEQRALSASRRALQLATNRYRDGAASYLDVVTAQTAALRAERSALDLQSRQRRASVQLIRALGGGWQAASLSLSPPAPNL